MSSGVPWLINSTESEGLVGQQPMLSPGDSGEFTFGFYGSDAISRYDTVRELGKYAGQYTIYETIEGDVYWREQRPSVSQLVHLRPAPNADSPTGRGIWGLVANIDDETTYSRTRCQLILSVVLIAPVGPDTDEFETEADLRTAREVHGP